MKKHALTILTVILFLGPGFAQQSIEDILTQIEQNNRYLIAIRAQHDAQKTDNLIGNLPEDPRVEFNYLWSAPNEIGPRIDLGFSQSFALPRVYKLKKQLSATRNEHIDNRYSWEVATLKTEVLKELVELTYLNACDVELKRRADLFQSLHDSFSKKMEEGEANLLDVYKAGINALNASKALEANQILIEQKQAQLEAFNGGIKLDYRATSWDYYALPEDLDTWIAKSTETNPGMVSLEQELVSADIQRALTKAMNFPSFEMGYMSETTADEAFRGLAVGMQIPLWENKLKNSLAKKELEALKAVKDHAEYRYKAQSRTYFEQAQKQAAHIVSFKASLEDMAIGPLLDKALENGEISHIEYYLEQSIYFESIDHLLAMERDYHMTLVKLYNNF